MSAIVRSLRSRHRAMIAHLQKDDSMVSLVPYGAGCFLAGGLLVVSGIAETHPKALAIASQLIQIGWWILQMQGLVWLQWMGGSAYQINTTFQVWVWALQLLDVHRRFLQRVAHCEGGCYETGGGGGGWTTTTTTTTTASSSSSAATTTTVFGPRQYYFNMIEQTMLFGTQIVATLTQGMDYLCDWPRSFLTPSSCPRLLQPSPSMTSPYPTGYGATAAAELLLAKDNTGPSSFHELDGQRRGMAWMQHNLSTQQQGLWWGVGHEGGIGGAGGSGGGGGGTMTAMVRWVIFETWTGLAVCGLMVLAWFVAGRVQRRHHQYDPPAAKQRAVLSCAESGSPPTAAL